MKRKIKTMVLTFLAVLFMGIGFLGFNREKQDYEIAIQNDEKTGDVELVNSDAVIDNQEEENDDYFSATRIDREKRYSQMLETYQKIIDSNEISSDQKGVAIEEIKNIENQKNGILISENLIKNKGFKDIVIFINEESANVVVKSNVTLLKEQIAQIQNIVSRELKINIENITISNK